MDNLKATLIQLEQDLLKPEIRHSPQQLNQYLADDFFEITSTGFCYNKNHALTRLPSEVATEFSQQDYTIKPLADGLVQLLYKATVKRSSDNITHYSLRCSIWQFNGEQWQMLLLG